MTIWNERGRRMIPKFRAFNKKTKKMYSVDGFKASERKIYRCGLSDMSGEKTICPILRDGS